MNSIFPALLFGMIAILVIGWSASDVPSTGQMAIIFPIGTNSQTALQLVRENGGAIVATTRMSNIVVALAPDEGFQGRIRAAGALFFFNAAGLCGDQGLRS